jgi:hypothetical protein
LPTINFASVRQPKQCALLNRQGRGVPAQWGTSKWAIFCLTIFVHARFGEPDGPKFEEAIAKLRKPPEQAFQAIRAVVLRKRRPL